MRGRYRGFPNDPCPAGVWGPHSQSLILTCVLRSSCEPVSLTAVLSPDTPSGHSTGPLAMAVGGYNVFPLVFPAAVALTPAKHSPPRPPQHQRKDTGWAWTLHPSRIRLDQAKPFCSCPPRGRAQGGPGGIPCPFPLVPAQAPGPSAFREAQVSPPQRACDHFPEEVQGGACRTN